VDLVVLLVKAGEAVKGVMLPTELMETLEKVAEMGKGDQMGKQERMESSDTRRLKKLKKESLLRLLLAHSKSPMQGKY